MDEYENMVVIGWMLWLVIKYMCQGKMLVLCCFEWKEMFQFVIFIWYGDLFIIDELLDINVVW